MKTFFTPQDIQERRGCYSEEQVNNLSFISKKKISINDILKSEISLKDKGWFVVKQCDLTTDQKKQLAYKSALSVLPIFEAKYPEDKRVRRCLDAILAFNEGSISREDLMVKRSAAAAAAAAYAAAAAADAYAAAAAAAAYAAAAAAAADAYAAAYAADAAADAAAAYKDIVLQVLIDFCKDNK